MKIADVNRRRAISPVIATVILIAITLIAAIAIAGFVFGLFGGFTSGARVSGTASCIGSTGVCNVALSNTGNAATTVISTTLQGGSCTTPTPISSLGSTTGVTIGTNNYQWTSSCTASSGQTFTMSVTLANGGIVPISGTFS